MNSGNVDEQHKQGQGKVEEKDVKEKQKQGMEQKPGETG